LDKAVASLEAIAGVDAIYLNGSVAENVADAHSDIDLRVVVVDGAYESVRAQREHLPTTWGPFLFHQTVAPDHTVSYYDSLTKADVFYYADSHLAPSPWFNLGTRILLDRRGRLDAVVAASAALRFTATPGEVVAHLQQSLAGLIECAKRMHRGEALYASQLRAHAIHHCLVADDLLEERAPFGSSKRETRIPGALTPLAAASARGLSLAGPPHEVDPLMAGLLELLARAEIRGQCDTATVGRLKSALAQLASLARGPAQALPLRT
jgi:hypothetical protein